MKEELQSVISNRAYQLLEGEPTWRQLGRCDTETQLVSSREKRSFAIFVYRIFGLQSLFI